MNIKSTFASMVWGVSTFCVAAPAIAEPDISIRFPVEYNLDIAPGIANAEFKTLLEERSEGRIEVNFFPSGNLYRGLDLVQAILRGDAEMTTLISAYWTAVAPNLAALELPYAFPNQEAFYKAVDDDTFMSQAYADVEAKGGTIIAVLPYDYLVPGTLKTPLRAPADVSGLRMRGLGKVNLDMFSTLGATPTSINFAELTSALQQGLIDGLNVPIDAFISYKWYEDVGNVTYAPYYIAYYPWVVNTGWWNSLEEADRELISSTAKEVALKHRERSVQVRDGAIAALREKGVDVHIQTEAEIADWRKAVQPVWDRQSGALDAELLARINGFSQK